MREISEEVMWEFLRKTGADMNRDHPQLSKMATVVKSVKERGSESACERYTEYLNGISEAAHKKN
jgi:hypothetical protein